MSHAVLFLAHTILAFVFANYGFDLLQKIPSIPSVHIPCAQHQEDCFGTLTYYRFTFALVVFFGTMSVAMCGVSKRSECRASACNNGAWGAKVAVLFLLTALMFVVPNEVFVAYGYVAIVGGGLFLLFQLVLLVDFAHSWSESWVAKWDNDDDNKVWFYALVGSTVVCYAAAVSLTIAMYALFTSSSRGDDACSLNSIIITVNLAFSLFAGFLSVHPAVQNKNPKSGLLQSAVVSLYTTYLVWSAIQSEPRADFPCSEDLTSSSTSSETTSQVIGAALVFVAVIYSAVRTSGSYDRFQLDESRSLLDEPAAGSASSSGEGDVVPASEKKEVDQTPVSYNYSFFHFIFTIAAMYVCMLTTNWDIVHIGSHPDPDMANALLASDETNHYWVDRSLGSVWVKVVSGWLAHLLYMWSLVAPLVLKDREFY